MNIMKNKLRSVLFCIGVLVVIFSGCQKQGQLNPPTSISANDINIDKSESGKSIGHTFDNTFTKYIFDYPFMMGVVGGDVGTGTYAGEVLNLSTVGDITSVVALYHFNGGTHSFTAHVFVTQNDVAGTATITGQVTDGWLKGAGVTGEYNVYGVCPISTPGNIEGTRCYQGTLHIQVPKTSID